MYTQQTTEATVVLQKKIIDLNLTRLKVIDKSKHLTIIVIVALLINI